MDRGEDWEGALASWLMLCQSKQIIFSFADNAALYQFYGLSFLRGWTREKAEYHLKIVNGFRFWLYLRNPRGPKWRFTMEPGPWLFDGFSSKGGKLKMIGFYADFGEETVSEYIAMQWWRSTTICAAWQPRTGPIFFFFRFFQTYRCFIEVFTIRLHRSMKKKQFPLLEEW